MTTEFITVNVNDQGQPVDEWGDIIKEDSNVFKLPAVPAKARPNLAPSPKAKSGSFSAMVADLEVGQSATRTHQLNEGMTLLELASEMREMKAMISNNARPSIAMAKERTGNDYRVETAESITTGGRVYLHVIATRIA